MTNLNYNTWFVVVTRTEKDADEYCCETSACILQLYLSYSATYIKSAYSYFFNMLVRENGNFTAAASVKP